MLNIRNAVNCPIYTILTDEAESGTSACCQCSNYDDEEYCCAMLLLKRLCEMDDAMAVLKECKNVFNRVEE